MPWRVRYGLAVGFMITVLAWTGWRGVGSNPVTLISRVDVIATAMMLAGLPWAVQRRFGAIRDGWLPQVVRFAGYLTVVALVLVKADVERVEYSGSAVRPSLGGLWVGEVVFLLVLAIYVAGLLAMTARRPPASQATLAIGAMAGVILGLTIYVVRPLEGPLHTTSYWLTAAYIAARLLAVPLVLGAAIAAGVAAARRPSHRGSTHRGDSPLPGSRSPGSPPAGSSPAGSSPAGSPSAGSPPATESRARQGMLAGLCAGAAAALLVSVLGISTIALAPHEARSLQWTLPSQGLQAGPVSHFEVSVSEAAAGYLLVLVLFPLFGAGLGAWGGLYGADRPGRPGGGGGGGSDGPEPKPAPPSGGLELDGRQEPAALDIRRILDLPPWTGVPPAPGSPGPGGDPELEPAVPDRRERTPAGAALRA
jgi:hypothetical protein